MRKGVTTPTYVFKARKSYTRLKKMWNFFPSNTKYDAQRSGSW